MLEYLKELLSARKAKLAQLQKRNEESEDLEEVRALATEITEVAEEIRSLETQIASLEAEQNDNNTEKRNDSGFNPSMALNVVATAEMNNGTARNEETNSRATMEYRTAFMNYVQRGERSEILQFETRANEVGVASELGVLLPETIVQQIMTELEGVYGQLYSRVRKTNIPGGVKYPIGSFSATFKRITETTTSDRQKAGDVTGYVQFAYNIGEIRIARTLLQSVLTVAAFEKEYAKVIVKAYVKAMDIEIIKGKSADNECEGILTEANKTTGSRIKTANIIKFTAEEIADWTKWEDKLFGIIPIAMEGLKPEFVMAKQTYVSNLVTLKDTTGQPIKKAGYDVTDRMYKFNEYGVTRVEKDIFKDFNSCADGEYFGMFWVPEEAYAINTNLEFYTKRYFDEETNQYVDKALVINDGKVLNPDYIYLLKKSVKA